MRKTTVRKHSRRTKDGRTSVVKHSRLGSRKCHFCGKMIPNSEDSKLIKIGNISGFKHAHRVCWKKYGWEGGD